MGMLWTQTCADMGKYRAMHMGSWAPIWALTYALTKGTMCTNMGTTGAMCSMGTNMGTYK